MEAIYFSIVLFPKDSNKLEYPFNMCLRYILILSLLFSSKNLSNESHIEIRFHYLDFIRRDMFSLLGSLRVIPKVY